jgi:uncharacterized protein YjbI with pentapeptide repeats/MinD-like ATPase involved in chromosome partitioning or flagellar assembly
MPIAQTNPRTEIIAFSSGKGGTGKTLIASSLGYSLVRAGHRVLMIDADPGTHGLSLFLMGPNGYKETGSFAPQNTFAGILRRFKGGESLEFEPRLIHRSAADDHGVSYTALISTTNIYGDIPDDRDDLVVPDLDRETFAEAVTALFEELRALQTYDYVLVDTRGGFAFETTDICALADSFILVTEPDYTSFYQDRNLVKRISAAAQGATRSPLLRSIIVNKATEGGQTEGRLDLDKLEASFRNELTREFPIKYANTHPVPLDLEAVKAYKTQQIPYLAAPGSSFSFSTLAAFRDILQVVTSRWSEQRVGQWNILVDNVSLAIRERNAKTETAKEEIQQRTTALAQAQSKVAEQEHEIAALRLRLDEQHNAYERELKRTEILLQDRSSPKAASKESAPRNRRWFALMVTAATLLALVGAGMLYRELFIPSVEVLVEKAYNVSLPPTLRISYIDQLHRRGLRNFDKIDLSNLAIPGAYLPNASFRAANLSKMTLQGATLNNVNFTGANLQDSDFSRASLNGADFTDANLSGAKLAGAQFRGSQLSNALLVGSDFSSAQLTGVLATSLNLSLTEVTDLSPLRNLKGLTSLNLSGTNVTDLSPLSGLTNLTSLNLSGTRVEDVSPLRNLKGLTLLDLGDTNVKDVSALLQLPNLRIIRGRGK